MLRHGRDAVVASVFTTDGIILSSLTMSDDLGMIF